MGQVSVMVLMGFTGILMMFSQVEHYNSPDVVEDEFQAAQGQIAWVVRRGQDTSDHLAFVEHELKMLWVQVRLEQKYLRHLIKEHVLPLQSYKFSNACQCEVVGDFRASPIPALFRDLHSEVSLGHGSPPPLESCSSDSSSFVSFWDKLNTIVEPKVSSVKSQDGEKDGSEVEDEEDGEEAWEDVGEGDPEGSIVRGTDPA